jgi:Cu/Ag efflux protein CusF
VKGSFSAGDVAEVIRPPNTWSEVLLIFWMMLVIVVTLMFWPDGGLVAEPEAGSILRYQLRGQMVQVVPDAQAVVVAHDDIHGWLEAMTMQYVVKDKGEFAKLHSGDCIRATVFVRDYEYWIGEIRRDGRVQ